MTLALFLAWLFVVVIGPGDAAVGDAIAPIGTMGTHELSLLAFMAVSAFALLTMGLFMPRLRMSSDPLRWSACAAMACGIGTVGTILAEQFALSPWVAVASAAVSALGSAAFVVLWGSVYMRMKLATAMINTSLSFCIAYMLAIVLKGWLPYPAAMWIAFLLPFACIPMMRTSRRRSTPERQDADREDASIGKRNGSIRSDGSSASAVRASHSEAAKGEGTLVSRLRASMNPLFQGFMGRCWVALALFGIACGTLSVICCDDLSHESSLTMDLVLFGGAVASVLMMLATLMTSRKETSWDHLFRTMVPVVMVGIALYGIFANVGYFPHFFLVISFLCIETLVWVFLASIAKDMDLSAERMYGIGFGLVQLGSLLGCVLYILFVRDPFGYGQALLAIGFDTPVDSLAASTLVDAMAQGFMMAAFALMVIVVLSFANAALPRYYELKRLTNMLLPIEDDVIFAGMRLSGVPSMPEEQIEPSGKEGADAGHADDGASSQGGEGTSDRADGIASDRVDEAAADGDPASDEASSTVPESEADGSEAGKAGEPAEDSSPNGTDGPSEGGIEGAVEDSSAKDASEGASTGEEADPGAETNGGDASTVKGSFKRRCDEISSEYHLSAREQEVFALLAKGHNAAFIMERLCISKSTAKTHINHIYKKMDIHTQQEILKMVEDRKRGPEDGTAQ